MARPPSERYARSLDRLQNGPFSGSISCKVTTSYGNIVEQLRNGSAKGGRALSILKAAIDVGYSEQHAIHAMVIAAPESDYNPNAINGETGAAGYFQLHPKHWSTSGRTSTSEILKNQLRQMYKQHGKRTFDDLAVLYGAHFYPGLGKAYSKSKTVGIQPGGSTFGQYAFQDQKGTVFHSPIIMALYATETAENALNISIELEVPKLPAAVTSTTLGGSKILQTAALEGPLKPTSKTRFVIAPGAQAVTISFLDPAGSSVSIDSAPSFDDVEWNFSKKRVLVDVSDDPVSTRAPETNPLFRRFDVSRSVIATPDNILAPSVDTLIQRIRDQTVDFEIMKANIHDIVMSSGEFGSRMERDPKTQRLNESSASARLRDFFSSDDDFVNFFENFSTTEKAAILQTMLTNQLDGTSLSGITDQFAMHDQVQILMQITGEMTEVEAFRDSWALPWFCYSGVLYPLSLLVTPSFDTPNMPKPSMIGQQFAYDLFAWTRVVVPDTGASTLISAVRSLMPSRSTSNQPKQRRS